MTSPADAVLATLARRGARVHQLVDRGAAAAEPLRFYARVLDAQAAAVRLVTRPGAVAPLTLAAIDRAPLDQHLSAFVAALRPVAPAALGPRLHEIGEAAPDRRRRAVDTALAPGPRALESDDSALAFVCDALVQPFAEMAAARWAADADQRSSAAAAAESREAREATASVEQLCPCCGGRPVVGVLREQGHGAGRRLVCGRCATEWPAPRVVCPRCAAIDVQALPVFRADAWPAIRIESCEQCRYYLKSVDLSVDGAAVPVVDDIASLSLDLWAREQGLRRAMVSLLRL